MNSKNAALAEALVARTYVQQGADSVRAREALLTSLLAQRRLPDAGWDELSVELLLQTLAAMDSNNFPGNIGAGEREARVFSPMVARRHFRLCHGVGRSGDVAAVQPKAAGSSLVVQLANALGRDALHLAGLRAAAAALVLPVATGMSLALVLLALRENKPAAKYVVWPRIDQKACLKAILTAGLTPVVVELERAAGGELRADVASVRRAVDEAGGPDQVLAVMTTTSCFAPRGFDRVEEIARMCQDLGVAHVVNNAYGVQSSKCVHELEQAMRRGRVDAVVQSLDKNFLMPVGGALVCSPSKQVVAQIATFYPGRASNTPALDFFITMLQMGRDGFQRMLRERKQLVPYMREQLALVAQEVGERLLDVPHNDISFAMTLSSFCRHIDDQRERARQLTFLGAMLFSRGVSGARVVSCLDAKTIGGRRFEAYGAHSNAYPEPYVTFACAIGMERREVDALVAKLRKTLAEWRAKIPTASSTPTAVPQQ